MDTLTTNTHSDSTSDALNDMLKFALEGMNPLEWNEPFALPESPHQTFSDPLSEECMGGSTPFTSNSSMPLAADATSSGPIPDSYGAIGQHMPPAQFPLGMPLAGQTLPPPPMLTVEQSVNSSNAQSVPVSTQPMPIAPAAPPNYVMNLPTPFVPTPLPTATVQPGKTPTNALATRRNNHRAIEARRREKINEKIAELKSITGASGSDKGSILSHVVEYLGAVQAGLVKPKGGADSGASRERTQSDPDALKRRIAELEMQKLELEKKLTPSAPAHAKGIVESSTQPPEPNNFSNFSTDAELNAEAQALGLKAIDTSDGMDLMDEIVGGSGGNHGGKVVDIGPVFTFGVVAEVVMDLQTNIIDCNSAFLKLLGYEKHHVINKPFPSITGMSTAADAAKCVQLRAALISDKIAEAKCVKYCIGQNNIAVLTNITMHLVRDEVTKEPLCFSLKLQPTQHRIKPQAIELIEGTALGPMSGK